MVSDDLLGVEDELVGDRDGVKVTGGIGLRAFLPESRESHPLEGGGLDTPWILRKRGGGRRRGQEGAGGGGEKERGGEKEDKREWGE